MKPSPKVSLPDKPSELIRAALADLEKAEMDNRYKVEMSQWHLPGYNGQCLVCLAGAVMAHSLGATDVEFCTPPDFEDECEKLKAIDDFREGIIDYALERLGIPHPEGLPGSVSVCEYSEDPRLFKNDMIDLHNLLEKFGL